MPSSREPTQSRIFVHDNGICESLNVGAGTRIWAFAHVLKGAVIGADCNICDQVFIENDVLIGDRVTIKCGVQIWDGITIENDVFIGPNATFTNDPFPRSKVYPDKFASILVAEGASIGANATILPGVKIGRKAMIGAGSVVTRDVPAFAIVRGNPARIVGYVDSTHQASANRQLTEFPVEIGTAPTAVPGVNLHRLKLVRDLRGDLSVGEFRNDLPFVPERYFLVFNVPSKDVRGQHAHKECHQFLICVAGSVAVMADDGTRRTEVVLDSPDFGIHLPPRVWGVQYKYSADAVLLVFASHAYDAADYLREYDEFLDFIKSNPGK